MEGIGVKSVPFFYRMDIKWKENGVNLDNSIDKTANIRYS